MTIRLKQIFYILTFAIVLTACEQNCSTTNNHKAGTIKTEVFSEPLRTDKQKTNNERLCFKNLEEVIHDKNSNPWVELKDSSASLALHFNLSYKDTLEVSFTSECWLMYPFILAGNKIIVYWDNNIDTKYEFDIVKVINKTDKKYIGKPFMILELVNDTTLRASYPLPDLIRKINSSSKKRTFFPNYFTVSKEYFP